MVDVLFGVVECKAGAEAAGYAVVLHEGVCAVGATAEGYTHFIEDSNCVVVVDVVEVEGDNAASVRWVAVDGDVVEGAELFECVLGECVFMVLYVGDADGGEII